MYQFPATPSKTIGILIATWQLDASHASWRPNMGCELNWKELTVLVLVQYSAKSLMPVHGIATSSIHWRQEARSYSRNVASGFSLQVLKQLLVLELEHIAMDEAKDAPAAYCKY